MVYAPPYTTTGFLYCIPGVAECISHFICCPSSLPLEVLGLYRQELCLCSWPRYGKAILEIALHKSNKQRIDSLSDRRQIRGVSFSLYSHQRRLPHYKHM